MKNKSSFGEVLEAVDQLSMEEQETLVDILQHRVIEARRAELANDIQDAKAEFQKSECQSLSSDEVMKISSLLN